MRLRDHERGRDRPDDDDHVQPLARDAPAHPSVERREDGGRHEIGRQDPGDLGERCRQRSLHARQGDAYGEGIQAAHHAGREDAQRDSDAFSRRQRDFAIGCAHRKSRLGWITDAHFLHATRQVRAAIRHISPGSPKRPPIRWRRSHSGNEQGRAEEQMRRVTPADAGVPYCRPWSARHRRGGRMPIAFRCAPPQPV